MKAVVMAGGFGTRLRPITEKLPKPMAYVANRPMMEHVVLLLKRAGIVDLEVLLYFYPDKITSYFGDGSHWDVRIRYLGAESDYGTAGAVKNAESRIQGTFLVISADIITDFDLSRAIDFHRERKAAATIVLTRVPNPLQYGIVITEEDGRIARFLEKPSWGEVFSDTVNTGIYILEPEVLSLIPPAKNFDWSKNVFPEMLSRGDRLLGYIAEGYWKDVGNLDEYLNVHLDILSGKVGIEFEGKKVGDGNVWIGENSRVDFTSDLQNVVIGKDCVVGAGVSAENVVLGDGCVVEDGAVLQSSVIWPRTTIHKGVRLLENIIGSDCVIRGRAFLAERAVISDHCRIGTEAVVKANVKVWPHKEVEDGAVLSSSLVWGEKWARALFSAYGIYGLANYEITPEFAAKVGAAFAATFGKKVVLSTSRDSHKTSRMINRAIMTGMLSVGVDVHDYGVTPLPVVRYLARSHREEKGGVHTRKSPFNPSFVDLKFFDDNGLNLPMSMERNIELLFFREDFVRADTEETGEISFPVGGFDTYVDGFLKAIDVKSIKERGFNIVLDYSYGSSTLIFPRILGRLGVEVVALNANLDAARITKTEEEFQRGLSHLSAISRSLNADFGVMLDTGGEKIFLVDEKGDVLPDWAALQVFCYLACRRKRSGKVGVPVTASRNVEKIAARFGMDVLRTRTLPRSLMETAAGEGVIFVGDDSGGYVFPRFQPAFDGMFAIVRLLGMLASEGRSLHDLLREIPPTVMLRKKIPCAWENKGSLMRMLADHAKGKPSQFIDGVKIFHGEDWALVYPSQDEAYFHLCVEAEDRREAEEIAAFYVDLFSTWSEKL
ncbi:MAG TPA: sugar phosphate nucleotidyltransferase [Candidatus Deferrimicrobiaceae bacterium]|nr:sugar phosphate nucleotidyltransferase [Candidatus Deferrimicrobiaceae bacterium]